MSKVLAPYNPFIPVYNTTGSTIPALTPVYITGADSPRQLITVAPAIANLDPNCRVIGLTTAAIPNNTPGEVAPPGQRIFGDTTTWNLGQRLYLSASVAGTMTASTAADQRYGIVCAVVTFRNLTAGVLTVIGGLEKDRVITEQVQADISTPTRAFSTNYTPNTDRDTFVVASVQVDTSSSITITGGTTVQGHVEFRSDNSATPTTERCRVGGGTGYTGTVLVGVAITSTSRDIGTLPWIVPKGQKYRLVTVNDSGTPTFTLVMVSEQST